MYTKRSRISSPFSKPSTGLAGLPLIHFVLHPEVPFYCLATGEEYRIIINKPWSGSRIVSPARIAAMCKAQGPIMPRRSLSVLHFYAYSAAAFGFSFLAPVLSPDPVQGNGSWFQYETDSGMEDCDFLLGPRSSDFQFSCKTELILLFRAFIPFGPHVTAETPWLSSLTGQTWGLS